MRKAWKIALKAYAFKEEVLYNALTNFKNNRKELGEFQEVKNSIVTKEEGEYKFHLVAQFEKRALDFDASLKADSSEFTSMSFVPEYSMEEKMASAGQNLLVGMGMVFAVLIFIAWIISLFKYIHIWEEKNAGSYCKGGRKASSQASGSAYRKRRGYSRGCVKYCNDGGY